MSIDIRREAEELVRYHAELVRRLAQSGVQDGGRISPFRTMDEQGLQ